MKLTAISISGLRSIQQAEINDCCDINVFIGKNNGGKSSLLTGIDLLFKVLRLGDVASFDPPHQGDHEHYNRQVDTPIRISADFQVEPGLIDKIVVQIENDYPQMRAAVEGMRDFSHLHVDVTLVSREVPVAYVSSIALTNGAHQRRVLLEVDLPAALELAGRARDIARYGEDSEALSLLAERADEAVLRRMRERYAPLPLFLRDADLTFSDDCLTELRAKMERADDFESSLSAISAYATEITEKFQEAKGRRQTNKFATFSGDTIDMPTYVRLILGAFDELKVLHLADRRRPIGADEAARLLQLKTQRGGAQLLATIQATVGSLLGVTIDAFSAAEGGSPSRGIITARRFRDSRPAAELDVDDFLVQVNGSGVKEALRLILDVEFEDPAILLLEEPEVHLHPALEHSVMRYLRELSAKRQIFMTTHSTNFIDTGEVQRVYLVRKDDSTQVEPLSVVDIETQIPRELGVRLSSVFMHDRLVFLEGVSDESVFREFAAKLSINLGKANVGFVTMGGSRNYGYYANNATVDLLSKRQVRTWFILDRDEKDAESVRDLVARLGGRGCLHVLKRRELENYLLSAGAVAGVISERTNGVTTPTAEDVQLTFDEVASSLKEGCIAKRVASKLCRPVILVRDGVANAPTDTLLQAAEESISEAEERLRKIRIELPQWVESSTAEVEGCWDSNKMDVVPGADVLDGALRKYGLRYKKERDGVAIARAMKAEEVPAELVSILRDISAT